MRNSRNEILSEHLLNVAEDILSNAYEIDDAEKLRNYTKAKNAKLRKPFYATPVFRAAVVAAACLALLIGAFAVLSPSNDPGVVKPTDGNNPPAKMEWPWNKEETDLKINSIDKLNYYTAMKALADPANVVTTAASQTTGEITLLSATVTTAKPMAQSTVTDEQDNDGVKIHYYKLDPDDPFSVSKVVFFQVELNHSTGFLASKVGTGIVDVVITENSLEPMITFRNGDRFYTCLQNSWFQNGREYSTHKYIDGFYIVKNLVQENYTFTVVYDNFNPDYNDVTAKSLTCRSFGSNSNHAADGKMPIVSKTYISDQVVEMTIADLEAFFKSFKGPGSDDAGEVEIDFDTYKNGEYAFVLYRDNTFIYYHLQTGAIECRGNYTRKPTEIQFAFTDGNTVTETVSCLLTGLDSFLYEGSIYKIDPY